MRAAGGGASTMPHFRRCPSSDHLPDSGGEGAMGTHECGLACLVSMSRLICLSSIRNLDNPRKVAILDSERPPLRRIPWHTVTVLIPSSSSPSWARSATLAGWRSTSPAYNAADFTRPHTTAPPTMPAFEPAFRCHAVFSM